MGIPKTDEGLRNYATRIYTETNAHKTEWSIPEADLLTLKGLVEDYDAKLTASKSPDRRKSDIAAKNESKKALEAYLPVYQGKNLDYNDAVTVPIRESLGLTVKDKIPSRIERPQRAPVAYLEILGAGLIALHYKPEGTAGSGRPYGYIGALIRHGVFDSGDPAPLNSEGLPRVRIGTKTPEVFEYPPEERGKKARFTLAWINKRGEIGVETEILEEIVP